VASAVWRPRRSQPPAPHARQPAPQPRGPSAPPPTPSRQRHTVFRIRRRIVSRSDDRRFPGFNFHTRTLHSTGISACKCWMSHCRARGSPSQKEPRTQESQLPGPSSQVPQRGSGLLAVACWLGVTLTTPRTRACTVLLLPVLESPCAESPVSLWDTAHAYAGPKKTDRVSEL